MARKIRIEYAGAACHVMARGNQGRDIYADGGDRKLWLETLGEACERTEGLRGVHGKAGAGVAAQAGPESTGGGVESDSAGMVCGRDRIAGHWPAEAGTGVWASCRLKWGQSLWDCHSQA